MIHPRALPRWFAKAAVLLLLSATLVVLAIQTFGTTPIESRGCIPPQNLSDEPIIY